MAAAMIGKRMITFSHCLLLKIGAEISRTTPNFLGRGGPGGVLLGCGGHYTNVRAL